MLRKNILSNHVGMHWSILSKVLGEQNKDVDKITCMSGI